MLRLWTGLLTLPVRLLQLILLSLFPVRVEWEKEAFPQIIHQLSARKHGPYIAVNCGAIPEGTIDSELFGHEKGSFTGAHEARKGVFLGSQWRDHLPG